MKFEAYYINSSSKRQRKNPETKLSLKEANLVSREDKIIHLIASRANPEFILEMIMDEYGTKIKKLVYSYVNNWDIATDLTQEVFITVYQKLDGFQFRSSFKTWIFTVAINKCKDYLKSWHYRNMVLNEKLFFFMKDTKKSPEVQVILQDVSNELYRNIWTLPTKSREVFILHYYEDLSIQEISDALNLSVSTVKTRLYRGKEKVKKLYSNEGRGEQLG